MAHMSAHSSIRRPRGFTLIELMAVVAIVSIIAGMVAPSLSSVGKKAVLRGNAHLIAAALFGAHQHAVYTGRCVAVAIDDTNPRKLVIAESTDVRHCELAASISGGVIQFGGNNATTLTKLSREFMTNEATQIVSISQQDLGNSGADVIVWRPNGYLRGGSNEYGSGATLDFSDNIATIKIQSTAASMPSTMRDQEIRVNGVGLTCVVEEGNC